MTLDQTLRDYLETSGESMRALSLRAGLNPKAVSDILNIPGLRPRHSTLSALSTATGSDLFGAQSIARVTYADLIEKARRQGKSGLVSKLRWLCRNAGWAPELKQVCKQDVIDFFESNEPARFNLSAGSYATYRSALVNVVGLNRPRERKRSITDIAGHYQEAYKAIQNSDLPRSAKYTSGPFFVFLHDEGIDPEEITTATLAAFYNYRVETSSKSAARCEKQVREISTLLCHLASETKLAHLGFVTACHPFDDARDKFGVDDKILTPLMEEFDTRVALWAQGHASRDGLTRSEFITRMDQEEAIGTVCMKKAKLRVMRQEKAGRPGHASRQDAPSRSELLRQAGFLVGKHTWKDETLKTRRGYIKSLAKAVASSADIVPETIDELTDPEFLDVAAETLKEANQGDYPSGYITSVLKTARKIARDYLCRPPEDLREIDDTIALHKVNYQGIAPRNMSKLRQFNDIRIQQTIDLSAMLLADIDASIKAKRKSWQKKNGVLPTPAEVLDPDLGRDVMATLAHDILLARAPRSANVLRARLDWIAWADGRARIVVPSSEVKMRSAGDADLTVQLGKTASKLMKTYLEAVRPAMLLPNQKANPYLFPGQGKTNVNGYYAGLLHRVTKRLHQKVGVRINPHLYRHLIGWIWLKDSLDNLPKVQRLLGHKKLQTTIDHYAELDESLVFDEWLARLDRHPAA
ncbi:site-specific integrase [Sulfitobacter delicatus]|uniref:Phage integrase family protein n=1 Tax=Sulfitobacter delicatus TaxID=218672 RepID=A0A1G7TRK5_9RHOB|nr:site-specific integrase [Sulfitobacter delicatus]SDG37802.1 Phage integrase family protein [Sulfitobacter delicatus]